MKVRNENPPVGVGDRVGGQFFFYATHLETEMKVDFSEMLWNVLESEKFQKFLYWLRFVDNPVRIVSAFNAAVENLQQQVARKNSAIDAIQSQNNHLKNELTLKSGQVLELKSDKAHLQMQINALEGEKQNLQKVLDESERAISNLQERVLELHDALAEAKERQVNVQQIEDLEGLLRYYQMQCRELQRQTGQESPSIQPAQEGGYSPRNMPLI